MENLKFDEILVVDADESAANGMVKILKPYCQSLTYAGNWQDAQDLLQEENISLCFLPAHGEARSAWTLIQEFRASASFHKKFIPFILTSGQGLNFAEINLGREMGSIGFSIKPCTFSRVLSQLMEMSREAQNAKYLHLLKLKAQHEIDKSLGDSGAGLASKMVHWEKELMRMQSDGLLALADLYEHAKLPEKAITLLRRALEKYEGNTRLMHNLAGLLHKSGNLAESLQWYSRAHKIAPGHLLRMRAMLQLYTSLRDPAGFEEIFETAMSVGNLTQKDLVSLAEDLFEQGMHDTASKLTLRAKDKLELIRFFNNRGVERARDSQYEHAIEEYEKALRLASDSQYRFRILFNIALANVNIKTPNSVAKAKEQLEETLRRNPGFEKAREMLSKLQA
jgi:tetratricopeptide (TPR) repeat protein